MSSAFYPPPLLEPEQLQIQPCRSGDPDRRSVRSGPLRRWTYLRRGSSRLLGTDSGHSASAGIISRCGAAWHRIVASVLAPDRHVIAYDAEGNGRACRLLWTLAALGHLRLSLLNGGIHAWDFAGPLEAESRLPTASAYQTQFVDPPVVVADRAYILKRLGQPDLALVDARTPG